MEVSKFGYWLQVGANVGILVGLILVGLQMKQTSDVLEVQLIQQNSDRYSNILWASVGDDFQDVYDKQLKEPHNLSYGEMRTLEASYWGALSAWIAQYRMHQQGIIKTANWKSAIAGDAPFLFRNTYGLS